MAVLVLVSDCFQALRTFNLQQNQIKEISPYSSNGHFNQDQKVGRFFQTTSSHLDCNGPLGQ